MLISALPFLATYCTISGICVSSYVGWNVTISPPWLTTSDIQVSIDPTIPPFFHILTLVSYWTIVVPVFQNLPYPPLSLVGIKVAPFGTPTHSSGGPTPCALCPLLHAAQISEAWNKGL